MNEFGKYLSTAKASKYFGVSRETLTNWEESGTIKCFRTKAGLTGHKRYDIDSFTGIKSSADPVSSIVPEKPAPTGGVCYCRVSTRVQKDDLARQVESMQEQFPDYKIIKDFGSGINFKRKGLLSLLKGAIEGDFSTVVVSHRDRLTRFGFELIEWVLNYHRVKLVVLDTGTGSKEQELCKDLLSIVHVFSCRFNGARRYKKKETSKDEVEAED